MEIKLLAFDLDGTTLTAHRHLSAENRRALERAGEKGLQLVPASGRMRTFLPPEITSIPGVRYVITANGAGVYDLETGDCVLHNLIPNEKAVQVQKLLDGYDIYIEYYSQGTAFTKKGYPALAKTHFHLPESKWLFITKDYTLVEEFGETLERTGLCPEKINLPFVPEAFRERLWGELEALGGLGLTSSISDNIEINSLQATKGGALKALCGLVDVSPEKVMAIGDNGNDVSMLRYAGCSVAVADASNEALEAAKHITLAHDENGLAKAIERWIL